MNGSIIYPSMETIAPDFEDYKYRIDCTKILWGESSAVDIIELGRWCDKIMPSEYYFRWVGNSEAEQYCLFIKNEVDTVALKIRFGV